MRAVPERNVCHCEATQVCEASADDQRTIVNSHGRDQSLERAHVMPCGAVPTREALRPNSPGPRETATDIKLVVIKHHIENDDESALQQRQGGPFVAVPNVDFIISDSGGLREKTGRVEFAVLGGQRENAISNAGSPETVVPMFIARG